MTLAKAGGLSVKTKSEALKVLLKAVIVPIPIVGSALERKTLMRKL